MVVLHVSLTSDFPALRDELEGLIVYHANPSCQTYLAFGSARPYPGSDTVEKNAVILIPENEPYTELAVLMDLLLGPHGCPWDREQSHETLKKYLLEESYETLDAIDRKDMKSLAEELGDLTLQPVFHARLAERAKAFAFDEPLREICAKLIRRHPHVFGDLDVADADEVLRNWDAIKKDEKPEKRSILHGVPKSMPALARAHEVSKRAVRAGFEWPDFGGVIDKIREETAELEEAIAGGDPEAIKSEIGDLLFTLVNVARWQKVDAEDALRMMLDRFQGRFELMEGMATKPLNDLSFEEWDDLWNQAKAKVAERA